MIECTTLPDRGPAGGLSPWVQKLPMLGNRRVFTVRDAAAVVGVSLYEARARIEQLLSESLLRRVPADGIRWFRTTSDGEELVSP